MALLGAEELGGAALLGAEYGAGADGAELEAPAAELGDPYPPGAEPVAASAVEYCFGASADDDFSGAPPP